MGLFMIPTIAHLHIAQPGEVTSAIAGVMFGAFVARRTS
jgi:hypothetical protein